jgi:hypothetical protein
MKNVLRNVFCQDTFEKLLIANWTQFLDSSKLLAFVLVKIQENANNFTLIESETKPFKGVRISISRFQPANSGFIIWVDFIAPISGSSIVDGTMELFLDPFKKESITTPESPNSHKLSISYISMLGNKYHLEK